MKKLIILCLICLLLQNCFYGSMKGFSSGYENYKNIYNIQFPEKLSSATLDKTKIYAVNAEVLKTGLKENPKSLVYSWSPNCHSDVCMKPEDLQALCDERNISLYIVAEYYDNGLANLQNKLKNPVFAINHIYYKTNYADSYRKKFSSQLMGISEKAKTIYDRYIYFENGNFVKSVQKPQL